MRAFNIFVPLLLSLAAVVVKANTLHQAIVDELASRGYYDVPQDLSSRDYTDNLSSRGYEDSDVLAAREFERSEALALREFAEFMDARKVQALQDLPSKLLVRELARRFNPDGKEAEM